MKKKKFFDFSKIEEAQNKVYTFQFLKNGYGKERYEKLEKRRLIKEKIMEILSFIVQLLFLAPFLYFTCSCLFMFIKLFIFGGVNE